MWFQKAPSKGKGGIDLFSKAGAEVYIYVLREGTFKEPVNEVVKSGSYNYNMKFCLHINAPILKISLKYILTKEFHF